MKSIMVFLPFHLYLFQKKLLVFVLYYDNAIFIIGTKFYKIIRDTSRRFKLSLEN